MKHKQEKENRKTKKIIEYPPKKKTWKNQKNFTFEKKYITKQQKHSGVK